MVDHRADIHTAVNGVILRSTPSTRFNRERLIPVFKTLMAGIGKVDVTELVFEWLKLIYGLARNPKTLDFAPVAAEQLCLQLRERRLKASYALQIEALTNLAEHLIIDCQAPVAAKVVLNGVAWATQRLESDRLRGTERKWANQEVADKVTTTGEACQRLLQSQSRQKRVANGKTREITEAVGLRQACEKIPVYFLAFRARNKGVTHAYDMYGAEWVDEPNPGCAIVSVPHFRNQFTLPRDTPNEKTIRGTETIDRGRYFVVDKIIDFTSEAELFTDLKERLKKKTLMVFIHGFRQSHASGLVQTAQMFKDFDLVGAPLLISWPSGYLLGDQSYFDAIENATSRQLPQKIARIVNERAISAGASSVVLIGHSLGARMLGEALASMDLQQDRFQIVLGSPDIAVDDFARVVKPAIAKRINLTVYASGRDKALRLASSADAERAGRVPHRIAGKGFDVVATDLCYSEYFDFSRHSDFSYGAAPDLRQALKKLSPLERQLRARKAPNKETYWSFG